MSLRALGLWALGLLQSALHSSLHLPFPDCRAHSAQSGQLGSLGALDGAEVSCPPCPSWREGPKVEAAC